jgi:hypothetical protein
MRGDDYRRAAKIPADAAAIGGALDIGSWIDRISDAEADVFSAFRTRPM